MAKTMSERQRVFVAEYLTDLNACAAAKRAGYSAATVENNITAILNRPAVKAAIAEAMASRATRTQITADAVLRRWWDIANADPRDLVQHRRVCCRHCWGRDHAYQWTAAEFEAASAKAVEANQIPPDPVGGLDFDRTTPPHPKCPECRGEGEGEVWVADTRRLIGPAALLYAGAKQGRDGLEIKLQDQARALENVAKHLGMFKTIVEGTDGPPIKVEVTSARERLAGRIAGLAARGGAAGGTGGPDGS